MQAWFEDGAFWRELYPFLFPEARFRSAGEEVTKIVELLGCRTGSVLDMCSGPGRHSVEFARRGFRVTGVDRTRYLLDKARSLAEEAGVSVEWVESDMRSFRRDDHYDLALSLFTSFGFFEDPEDDRRVLAQIHRSLVPGGTLLMDLSGKEVVARKFRETVSSVLEDGSILVQRHEVTDSWRRIENHWILLKEGRARDFRFSLRIYSAGELMELLRTEGFDRIRAYGSLDGDEYGTEARRLVVSARRPPL